jgi:gamma-glutamyltranspeptidase/glutathione hydrolase
MVATPHWSATCAGVDVLRRGGTAVDAAIAANGVLSVVYPASCGLGGDAFWLVYEPRTREVVAYNGSGRAPAALNAASLRERGLTAMPLRGALSVTVPGAVRSWEDVGKAHGRFALDELLRPAEAAARDGFVVTDVVAEYFAANEALLRVDPDAEAVYLARGCPKAGDVLANLPLAATLHAIRSGGADAFYRGPIAESIARWVSRGGNPMSLTDLAAQRTERLTPARIAWHGAEVYAHPPNSQAAVALMVLGALANDGAASDLDWTHLAIEAIKSAFDSRDARFSDPHAQQGSIDELLTPEAFARVRAAIDPAHARKRPQPVDRGGTIAIVAIDGEGRAVSLLESLYMSFGSGLLPEGTGVLLHDRGAYFSLEEGHPNELAGGKRPLHTLSPGMLLRDGLPEFIYGAMGGDGQPQTHVQLIHNVYERGMSVQAAVDAPRFVYGRDSESAGADTVAFESRAPADLLEGLRVRGHAIEVLGPYENRLGHAHAIFVDRARGTLCGASDPRADSAALGL